MARVTWRGVTVDDRTAKMLTELAKISGAIYINPTQGSYNSGVSASAGTHDGCGAVDLMHPSWSVKDYDTVVALARKVGFAAWHRTPQQSNWPRHCHLIAVQPGGKGDRGCLSSGAYSQVVDYYENRNGLASRARDDGPRTYVGQTWEKYVATKNAPVRIKVGTANLPHRLRPHRETMKWFDSKGADVVVAQEHTDGDNWAPSGWERVRPKRGQSNTIYFRTKTMRKKKVGSKRMSSPGFRSYRDLLWVSFRVKKGGGRPVRIGGIHLPAFKTSSKTSAAEFRKQEPMAASWLSNGPNRVLGGDFNANPTGVRWCPNLRRVGRWSRGVESGPKGQKIDFVGAPKDGKWKVVKTERGPKFRSDHNPVLVTLEWVG